MLSYSDVFPEWAETGRVKTGWWKRITMHESFRMNCAGTFGSGGSATSSDAIIRVITSILNEETTGYLYLRFKTSTMKNK